MRETQQQTQKRESSCSYSSCVLNNNNEREFRINTTRIFVENTGEYL